MRQCVCVCVCVCIKGHWLRPKERKLKNMNEKSSEKKSQVETDLNHAREWKKEREVLIRDVNDLLISRKDLRQLLVCILGLLSSKPTMEQMRKRWSSFPVGHRSAAVQAKK
jgi:hypothetical protein